MDYSPCTAPQHLKNGVFKTVTSLGSAGLTTPWYQRRIYCTSYIPISCFDISSLGIQRSFTNCTLDSGDIEYLSKKKNSIYN